MKANAEIAHRLEQSLQKEDEAAYMSRFASIAADKFSADVAEKLNATLVRSFGTKAAERFQLAAAALMAPILARIREPTAQDLQKAAERAQLETVAAFMMSPSMVRRLLQELSEQDAQKPPTTAPERPDQRKEGN